MKNEFSWRYRLTQIALAMAGIAIVFQIVYTQNRKEAGDILNRGWLYEGKYEYVYPPRGEIYDREGHLLAGNDPVYHVGLELLYIRRQETIEKIALALQVHLGLDYEEILDTIADARAQPPEDVPGYLLLGSYIPYENVQAFIDFRDELSGSDWEIMHLVYFLPERIRTYPEKMLAANVLGLINLDGTSVAFGIEEKYDSLLSGTAVRAWIPNNPNEAASFDEVAPATSLILTIDRDIQAASEQILDEAIGTYGAESGIIIVADPRNGEILAMAANPRIDPNQYWKPDYLAIVTDKKVPFNPAVSDVYEPGSVFKIITMAAALDKGVIVPETTYNDATGIFVIGGFAIHNWENTVWGVQDMTGCLQHSMNVCLAWVATELGEDDFYAYLQRFGIGHQTGIDLAGENTGIFKTFEGPEWETSYWDEVELGINAYGQGVSVTPVQMIMAVSAVANDGQMYKLHVLRATVQDGRQYDIPTELVGTPISKTTADTLAEMLANSLENETRFAKIPGYRLAGKTGTATIQDEPNTDLTNASFVGWGPVDDPRFIIYVWLEKPTESIWGSETAAPIFRDVAEQVILIMGIPPDQVRMSLSGQ